MQMFNIVQKLLWKKITPFCFNSKKFLDNIEHLHWLGYILEKVVKKCNVAANFPLTRSILGWWIGLADLQTFPTGMLFRQLSSVFRSFAPSQDTFEKSPKRKNSHHRWLRRMWAQESVLRLSQIKCWLDVLPIPFPHAIRSASNTHKSFKYNILSNYAVFIAIHDTCKKQT